MGILVTCTSSKSLKTQDVYFESRLSNLQEKISAFSALVFENMQKPSFDKMFYCERCDSFDFVIMDLEEEAEKLLVGKEKALRALRELEKLVRQIENRINQHTPLLSSAEAFSEPAGAFFWGMAFSLVAQGVTYIKQRIDCYFSSKKIAANLERNREKALPEAEIFEEMRDEEFETDGLNQLSRYPLNYYKRWELPKTPPEIKKEMREYFKSHNMKLSECRKAEQQVWVAFIKMLRNSGPEIKFDLFSTKPGCSFKVGVAFGDVWDLFWAGLTRGGKNLDAMISYQKGMSQFRFLSNELKITTDILRKANEEALRGMGPVVPDMFSSPYPFV